MSHRFAPRVFTATGRVLVTLAVGFAGLVGGVRAEQETQVGKEVELEAPAGAGVALPLNGANQPFLRLHQELPYSSHVETEKWEERRDGSVRIDQIVYVARDGHKGIALGPKGATIKAVGQAAREELKAFLGRDVHLFLTVKVRPNWLDEAERYGEMGLEFPRGE